MYDKLIKELREYWNDGTEDIRNQAADAIEELQKQLREKKVDNVNLTGWIAEEHARAEEAKGWIPVTERLPDENDVVLITDSLDVGTGYLVHGYGWISPFDDIEMSLVSHWMPLPEPPKSEGE